MSGPAAFPLVIAAPSGAGKTSLAHALVERHAELEFALSATTRAPRPGEQHDVAYHFVDDVGFERLVASGDLLEWALVHGRRYGTLRRGVAAALMSGKTVVLDIDVQGARMVRSAMPSAVLVFVLPPTLAEMRRRLFHRGSGEDSAEVARRLVTARAELDAVTDFDYVIVNDDFADALCRLEAILVAEQSRVQRQTNLATTIAALRADIDTTMEGSH